MKKVIAILMVFGLFTASVFAEVSFSGTGAAAFDVVQQEGDGDMDAKVREARARLKVEATNDDATFGGYVELRGEKIGATNYEVWWQPIPQLKLQIGQENDGILGAAGNVVDWNYHGAASDYVVIHNYFMRDAFFGGWGGWGPTLTITPIEGLNVNLALPVFETNSQEHFIGQLTYGIPNDIGTVAFTFVNNTANQWDTTTDANGDTIAAGSDAAALYGAFHLGSGIVEGLDLSIGARYVFRVEAEDAGGKNYYDSPVWIGFGAAYAVSDAVGVKFRLSAGFGGKKVKDDKAEDEKAVVKLGLMPYFDFGVCKFNLDLGLGNVKDNGFETWGATSYTTHQDDLNFYVNPYITKSIGPGTFFAGFRLATRTFKAADEKKTEIDWGIPVAIVFSF